jgi:hypothetical protein
VTPWVKSMGLLVALGSLASAAPAVARAQEGRLVRALSCRLGDGEIATLMAALAIDDVGMKVPIQSFAAPSGNLYRLKAPVSALGYSTNEIYVSPGRMLMVVSGQKQASVSAKLSLTPAPYSPDERRLDGTHALIAYQLHQEPLADKVLIGCAYDDPAAAVWLAPDAAGF